MTMATPIDVAAIAHILAGKTLNGELDLMSSLNRGMASYLNGLPVAKRLDAWLAMTAARSDGPDLVTAAANADPNQPIPTTLPPPSFATADDIAALNAGAQWVWPGFIPLGRISGLGAAEGTGKTRVLMDVCRRQYLGLEYPDGQPATLPPGTRSLWMCADGHQDEIAVMAGEFGIPGSAICFPTPPDDPYGGVSLDDPDMLEPGGILETAVASIQPGLVIIDTLTYATTHDLCSQGEIAALKTPLVRIAQQYQTSIILALHLSKEGQALGRRIKGITRTLIHLECPDSNHPERLRLWVEKSFAKKPPALGVTMHDAGCDYDETPPAKANPNQGGRPPESRDKAIAFIIDALTKRNDEKAAALCDAWIATGGKKSAYWDARDMLVADGTVIQDGKPFVLHLVSPPSPDPSQGGTP